MKTRLIALFVALLFPMVAQAQSAAPPGQIAADGQLAFPLGNFGDLAGFGFGVLGRYERNVMPRLNITGRIGFIYHLSKDHGNDASTSFYTIPILAGVKYDLTDAFYAAGELGVFSNHSSVTLLGMSISGSETDLGLTLGGGYRMGEMDIRLGLYIWDLGHAGDTMSLVGGFGWTFWRG